MRLLSTFLHILRLDTAPAPLPTRPPVAVEALLDLALVMQERWEGAALSGPGYESHGLVNAALARCFPCDVVTVETCSCEPSEPRDEGEPKCSECATNAQVAAADATLRAWLRDCDRPEVTSGGASLSPFLPAPEAFQRRVQPWMLACFGPAISADRAERNHRFLEEALELVQALGCSREEARQLVDYTYGRPLGHPGQEVGGVMVTLAALCLANAINMHGAGEVELAWIWTKVEQIRAKQAAKPPGALPEAAR